MNAKKSAPKKRKYKKTNAKYWRNTSAPHAINGIGHANLTPFEIEIDPPSYRLNPDLVNTLNRVEATIKLIQPGQAFIVPSKSKNTIKKSLEEKWPSMIFRFSLIKDNPGMMRVYFLKHV